MTTRTVDDQLTIGLAQYTPVLLNRGKTLEKAHGYLLDAAKAGCEFAVLGGEGSVGGYPFWLELTGGAVFESRMQKEFFAEYSNQAVQVSRGDLDLIMTAARDNAIAVYIGIIEKPADRGESLFCSLVYINERGEIGSIHRKLMPTYEERLAWSSGDGNGLRVHKLGAFTVGGLNCWENWMPLARTSLYAQGEDLHVTVWPGSVRNTRDITRFIAKESRSYVASVSCTMSKVDFPPETPHLDKCLATAPDILTDGGTCLAGPDGEWLVEPVIGEEKLIVATIDHSRIREERQNFDPAGHYSRPDVFRLNVNRERQTTAIFDDD